MAIINFKKIVFKFKKIQQIENPVEPTQSKMFWSLLDRFAAMPY